MLNYAPQCDGCRKIYAGRNPPNDPPCDACREEPADENRDALKVFSLVNHQFIMGMGGPIDINHQAIHEAIRLHGIKNRKECFEKVLVLSRWWLGEIGRMNK